jgi:hypothetical protein
MLQSAGCQQTSSRDVPKIVRALHAETPAQRCAVVVGVSAERRTLTGQ